MSSKLQGSLKPSVRDLFRNWWPVAVWLVVIRLESTDYASASNTFSLMYRVAQAIFGRIDPAFVFAVDRILRKCGHIVGYAILSLLVFLALKYTHRDRLRPWLRRPWGIFLRDIWQLEWAATAVLFTAVTGAFDEIHQSFIPSRTSSWHDVALDTAGALVIQLLLYFRASHLTSLQSEHLVEKHEPSLTQ